MRIARTRAADARRLLSLPVIMSLSTTPEKLQQRPPPPVLIDTDCGLDDLATLALAAASSASLRLVTTTSGLAPHGHGHLIARSMLDHVGLNTVPVVAGGECPPSYVQRERADWEQSYGSRVAEATRAMGMETSFAEERAQREPCDAAAAADAIVEAARASGGNATILALGALTNVAEAVRRHPEAMQRLVSRIVFIGDTDSSRHSYNVALDPAAMRAVLASSVDLVLIGSSCYASPGWVAQLFAAEEGDTEGGTEGRTSSTTTSSTVAPDGEAAVAREEPASCAPQQAAAARAMRALGSEDPYSMCYDPLALLYHLEPEAFEAEATRIPVRVSGDVGTADGWLFERCEEEGAVPEGHVLEVSGVSLARYEAFLRRLCML